MLRCSRYFRVIRGKSCRAVALCLLLAQPAVADDQAVASPSGQRARALATPPALDLSLEWVEAPRASVTGSMPAVEHFETLDVSHAAPAAEMAAGLNVEVGKKRRRLRNRVVNWVSDRSAAMGTITDLLLAGSESGWHLVVDATGTQHYLLEWQTRFH